MELGAPTDRDPSARQQKLVLLLLAAGALVVVLATVLGFCAGRNASPSTAPSAQSVAGAAPGGTATPISGLPTVTVAQLPSQARDTLVLIDKGGPYPYSRDGIVFANAERVLPQRPRGYYHEFTVETPGSRDRGARRLVVGDGGDTYYTDDHYASFRQVIR
jgi:ribonuclease T1